MSELQVPDTADDDAEGFHSITYHPGTLLPSPASPTLMHHCSPLTHRRSPALPRAELYSSLCVAAGLGSSRPLRPARWCAVKDSLSIIESASTTCAARGRCGARGGTPRGVLRPPTRTPELSAARQLVVVRYCVCNKSQRENSRFGGRARGRGGRAIGEGARGRGGRRGGGAGGRPASCDDLGRPAPAARKVRPSPTMGFA